MDSTDDMDYSHRQDAEDAERFLDGINRTDRIIHRKKAQEAQKF
jgi:hypothetical protein